MKNAIIILSMMLCVASCLTFHSCSDDPGDNISIETLTGTWRCRWSTPIVYCDLAENAYAGAEWTFDAPNYTNGNEYHGIFHVKVNGTEFDGFYFYYDNSALGMPRLGVRINGDDQFYMFHGLTGEDKYSVLMPAEFSLTMTGSTLNAYRFNNEAASFQDLELYLKFEKSL